MSILNLNFCRPEALGEVIYYMNRPERWCWKVVDMEGKTIVSPSMSFHSRKEAEQSFSNLKAIMESLPSN